MTRSRYGLLAGIAGPAFAAWWWRGRTPAPVMRAHAHDRGETIFSNTPQPTENDALGG